jgi:hypothetical protein
MAIAIIFFKTRWTLYKIFLDELSKKKFDDDEEEDEDIDEDEKDLRRYFFITRITIMAIYFLVLLRLIMRMKKVRKFMKRR